MSDRLAVMRHGRIEQIGPPEEVYERPATEFVAGFLGASNLLDGKVEERGAAETTVRLRSGSAVIIPSGTDGLPLGARVRVGVRPEKIRLQPDDGESLPGWNAVAGVLQMATYIGVSHQFSVEGPDERIMTVYQQNLGAETVPAPGQRVRLVWRPEHTFVVVGSADQVLENEEEET
jgi:spermidine/putrescine transport system ATP-binding protein